MDIGKRLRSAKDEDADEHTRKRSRICRAHVKTLSAYSSPLLAGNQRQNLQRRLSSQPARKGPPSKKIVDSSKPFAQAGRRTRYSARVAEIHQRDQQEQPVAEESPGLEHKSDRPLRSYSSNLGAKKSHLSFLSQLVIDDLADSRVVKRQRSIEDVCLSDHDAKRPKSSQVTRRSRFLLGPKEEFVNKWLSESCWSQNKPIDKYVVLEELSENMPRKPPTDIYTPPDDTFGGSGLTSRRSTKSTANVNDKDYRESLEYRNIYIDSHDPPLELMRRAEEITSRPRASPEMDDATARELSKRVRRVQSKAEDDIIQQLGSYIIPSMQTVPDQRLEQCRNQWWCNSVPVPLDPVVLANPLPLPRPKPDLAFGYSKTAFSREQLSTIKLLVDEESGCSYAVPDQMLQFPFLSVEFKSPAKNGTLYVATNQVAGAGAIALNGNLELLSRCSGAEIFDFDEPHFFSITMDNKIACVNVHWVGDRADGGQYSFHLEELSLHVLKDANSARALQRAIKNILDHGSTSRLQIIRNALDTYRQKVIEIREAAKAATAENQRDMIQTQPQLPSPEMQADRSQNGQAEEITPANAENHHDSRSEGKSKVGPQRKRGTAQRQVRNQTDVPTKAARTRRSANAVGR